jgi:hypothetical protein
MVNFLLAIPFLTYRGYDDCTVADDRVWRNTSLWEAIHVEL